MFRIAGPSMPAPSCCVSRHPIMMSSGRWMAMASLGSIRSSKHWCDGDFVQITRALDS